jgi:hypothetical protein
VGERFSELGRVLRQRWAEHREDDTRAAEEVRDAVDGVRTSLDDLADTITRTVNDPDVQASARQAATGLIDALTESLDQLSELLQPRRDDRPGPPPGPDGPAASG